MRLTFLGTSSATPTRTRNVSSLAVTLEDGNVWLVDCGEGTQQQLARSTVRVRRITRILLTHLHGDHCLGTVGLLGTLGLLAHTNEVQLVGPVGIRELIETTLRLTHTSLPYPITFIELHGPMDLGTYDDVHAHAVPIVHRVPCFGYVLRGKSRRGALDVALAQRLGVPPGPHMGRLARGEDVVLDDGVVVHAAQVLGDEIAGVHAVLLGDTSDASAVLSLGRGCDVLVHEATFDEQLASKAAEFGHSTARMAGAFAQKLEAKRLILSHFSARYGDDTSGDTPGTIGALLHEARAACPSTHVEAAHDLLDVTITR